MVERARADPLVKKSDGPGTAIDVPLGHKDAAFVRSHFDAIEVRVTMRRAPTKLWCRRRHRRGRPLPRVGGLKKDEIKGVDGLR